MTNITPAQKCRCASGTHGHKLNSLASEPGLLCKPCHDQATTELNEKANIISDEVAVNELLNVLTKAIQDKKAESVIATLSDDAVGFDLAPPLRLGPEVMQNPAHLEATWKGPISSEPLDRTIVVDGDIAYAYGLQRMTGTKINGDKVELWFRASASVEATKFGSSHICITRCLSRWMGPKRHCSI
jgi:ketosteroid isomerase-like protein